jgi:hypothetical protein
MQWGSSWLCVVGDPPITFEPFQELAISANKSAFP